MKHRCMTRVTNAVILAASCICLRGSKTTAYLATRTSLGIKSIKSIKRANQHYYKDEKDAGFRAASIIIRTQSASSVVELDALSATPPPLLPPEDDTCSSPIAAIRELLVAPALPAGSARYDEIGVKTGGIWRTKRYGITPCTVSRMESGELAKPCAGFI